MKKHIFEIYQLNLIENENFKKAGVGSLLKQNAYLGGKGSEHVMSNNLNARTDGGCLKGRDLLNKFGKTA